jgi:hypothetical protein
MVLPSIETLNTKINLTNNICVSYYRAKFIECKSYEPTDSNCKPHCPKKPTYIETNLQIKNKKNN